MELANPGLDVKVTYRPATQEDSVAVADLLNACYQALRGMNLVSPQGLLADWAEPGFDLAQSTLAAVNAGGAIVGYAEIWDLEDLPVQPFIMARVHPDFRGHGIGTHLMQWAEARAHQAIPRAPAEAMVKFRTAAMRGDAPSFELLHSLGMSESYSFREMGIEFTEAMPQPHWPEGIAPRAYDSSIGLRAVYDCWTEAFQDHRGYVPGNMDESFARWRHWVTTNPEMDFDLWYLAMDGDEMAGVVICMRAQEEDPEMGWIDKLAVRRPWRRRGLGTALLLYTFHRLHARGFRRAGLGVDATSLTGATRLYEAAGMHDVVEYVLFDKQLRPGIDLSRQ